MVIAAIIAVSGNPTPVAFVGVFAAVFVLMYLYLYLIRLWVSRRRKL